MTSSRIASFIAATLLTTQAVAAPAKPALKPMAQPSAPASAVHLLGTACVFEWPDQLLIVGPVATTLLRHGATVELNLGLKPDRIEGASLAQVLQAHALSALYRPICRHVKAQADMPVYRL